MRKLWSVLLVLVAVVSLSGGTVSPAAASTYTVTPGGAFSGGATTSLHVQDTITSTTINCAGSSFSGTIGSGTSAIATITSMGLTSCTGPTGAFSISVPCLPVTLSAVGYSGGVTTVNLGVCLSFSGPLCSFALNGSLPGHYTNATAVLALSGTLTVSGSGCFGLMNNGDGVLVNVAYRISPPQTITSP